MRGTALRVICAAATLSMLAAFPALATGTSVQREGSCSGPGHWRLRASRESATTIRVRFDIEHADPGDSWQLFLSDNGTRIFAGTRVVDPKGELHVTKVTADRSGKDRIKASGVDITAGGSCSGALTY
jgi:hypothetical protein